MQSKSVVISGRKFKLFGNEKDRYFDKYLSDGNVFSDVPIVVIEKYCPEDGVVIDLGANIGAVFCSASVVAPKGTIYAYEASKKIYGYADKALKTNKIKNVELYNIALSEKKGTLKFYEDPNFLAGSRVANANNKATSTVKAMPLDDLVKDLGIKKIDILKIDVEGHEEEVLKGAQQTLKKYKPMCLIEFNSYAMITFKRQLPQDFMEILKKLFPRIYVFDRNTMEIRDITDDTDRFITHNLLNGCVDDLVCMFGDLPEPGKWFIDQQSRLASKRRPSVRTQISKVKSRIKGFKS